MGIADSPIEDGHLCENCEGFRAEFTAFFNESKVSMRLCAGCLVWGIHENEEEPNDVVYCRHVIQFPRVPEDLLRQFIRDWDETVENATGLAMDVELDLALTKLDKALQPPFPPEADKVG